MTEGSERPLDDVIGQASLSDGPAEVSDDEDGGTAENLDNLMAVNGVGEVPELEESASEAPQVVPDTDEQLINFDDDDEGMDLGEETGHHEEPAAEDEFDLPPPPPPLEQDSDDCQ